MDIITRLIGVASLLLAGAGCTSSDTAVESSRPANKSGEMGNVTLYVAGMNRQLKIL